MYDVQVYYKRGMNKTILSVRIEPETLQALDKLAKTKATSRSKLLQQALVQIAWEAQAPEPSVRPMPPMLPTSSIASTPPGRAPMPEPPGTPIPKKGFHLQLSEPVAKAIRAKAQAALQSPSAWMASVLMREAGQSSSYSPVDRMALEVARATLVDTARDLRLHNSDPKIVALLHDLRIAWDEYRQLLAQIIDNGRARSGAAPSK